MAASEKVNMFIKMAFFAKTNFADHLVKSRLSQKSKKLEYQKSLLTLDLGWSNKLSCKILAFYLENRKSGDHLKF